MVEGIVVGVVLTIAISLWLKSQQAKLKTPPANPKVEALKARIAEDVGEFFELSRNSELRLEIQKWQCGLTIDDPNDPRSVVPPGHRVIGLAAELADVGQAAGDSATHAELWTLAGHYNTAHEAQLAEIQRYAKAVDDFIAGNADAGAAKYLREQVLEHFPKLESAWKAFSSRYRQALDQHGTALEERRRRRSSP